MAIFASVTQCAAAVVRVCQAAQKDAPSLEIADIEGEVRSEAASVLMRFDWLFLTRLTTTESEANENTYVLSGANNDCGRVLDLKYNGIPIDYKDWAIYQNLIRTLSAASTTPRMWTVKAVTDDGFPQIEIYGTPTEADIEIEYRYKQIVEPQNPEEQLTAELWDYVYFTLLSIHYPFPRKAERFAKQAEKALASARETGVARTIDVLSGSDTLTDSVKERNFEINLLASDSDFY